ncbi:hypothetical protein [Flavisphingomonas formosensis]|uniref:hypothetical protein n=1 Tax=Flavisphingomonas formosensis TaxID=861534 RepID=UPI0012F831C9|nr:hypothetical protein [Sphingomonas formosensis]
MADKPDTIHANPDEEAVVEERVTEEKVARMRHAKSLATDDADASHQGGFGAQGGQVDFGKPKNYGQ